jgi:tripartite-type tricarboxylate transporter receptor subunit TctC
VAGRIVFQKVSENLGQQFVIDNRPGATGSIGAELVAKSPPDGYTLMVHSMAHLGNPFIYKKLAYERLKAFPNAPTVAEAGVPGYEYTGWVGVFAPAGVPTAIVDRMNMEIRRAIESADTAKRLEEFEPWTMTPAAMAERIKVDYDKFARLMKLIGDKVD